MLTQLFEDDAATTAFDGWREDDERRQVVTERDQRICRAGDDHHLVRIAREQTADRRNLSNVVVANTLGTTALGKFAIGRFCEPVVLAVRGSLTAVLLIDAPDDEVIRRLSGRRTCVKNQHVYHLEFDPPKNPGVCDQDGSRLVQRDDDRPETVQNRLSVYHEQTAPLVDWYGEKGLLRRFDGALAPEEVHSRIRATLATLALEAET